MDIITGEITIAGIFGVRRIIVPVLIMKENT